MPAHPRRLEVAAERLVDPGHAHLAIGALAYGCGFANQAHVAKRFRARFGLTPSDYRRAAAENATLADASARVRST